MTSENLKSVNQEILKNEERVRKEMDNNTRLLHSIKKELESALASKNAIHERNLELQKYIEKMQVELKRRSESAESDQINTAELKSKLELMSSKLSSLTNENDTLKTTCNNLRKEKDVLMATYCRAVKENEKLQESLKSFSEASKTPNFEKDVLAYQNVNSSLEKRISRT
jgi:predicted  nucleic acid-binding Zn-ribbon protein